MFMQLTVNVKNLEADEVLQDLVKTKFDQLGNLYDRIRECNVLIEKNEKEERRKYRIKANVAISRRLMLAASDGETIMAALNKLTSDIEGRISRQKEEREEIW